MTVSGPDSKTRLDDPVPLKRNPIRRGSSWLKPAVSAPFSANCPNFRPDWPGETGSPKCPPRDGPEEPAKHMLPNLYGQTKPWGPTCDVTQWPTTLYCTMSADCSFWKGRRLFVLEGTHKGLGKRKFKLIAGHVDQVKEDDHTGQMFSLYSGLSQEKNMAKPTLSLVFVGKTVLLLKQYLTGKMGIFLPFLENVCSFHVTDLITLKENYVNKSD